MSIFDKFNKSVDLEGLKKDLAEIKTNTGEFKEVPLGTYEVKIDKMEIKETKKGDNLMLSVQFKILAGEYKNSRLFMNQLLTANKYGLHNAKEFLSSLGSGIDVVFEDFGQFNDLVLDITEAINGKLEYAVEYGDNKGFKTFKITEIFDAQ